MRAQPPPTALFLRRQSHLLRELAHAEQVEGGGERIPSHSHSTSPPPTIPQRLQHPPQQQERAPTNIPERIPTLPERGPNLPERVPNPQQQPRSHHPSNGSITLPERTPSHPEGLSSHLYQQGYSSKAPLPAPESGRSPPSPSTIPKSQNYKQRLYSSHQVP